VIGFREASAWTAVWATLALLFCLCLYKYAVWKFGATNGSTNRGRVPHRICRRVVAFARQHVRFLCWYSAFFGIPALLQHRVLFFGILGALIFRGVFIALGAALLQYGWVVILFGIFLILTGIQMMFSAERQVQPETEALSFGDCEGCCPWRRNRKAPRFLRAAEQKNYAPRPFLLALAFIEATDILFALDSVPAIFAITPRAIGGLHVKTCLPF